MPQQEPAASISSLQGMLRETVRSELQKDAPANAPTLLLEILPAWVNWVEPPEWAEKLRKAKGGPIDTLCSRELKDFASWLPANARLDPEKTAPRTVTYLRALLGMLSEKWASDCVEEIDDATWSVSVVVALRKQQLVGRVFGLRVLGPNYGWSRGMLTALKHFVNYAKSAAIQKGFQGSRTDVIDIESDFQPITITHTESRVAAGLEASVRDAELMEGAPDRSEVKLALMQAMRDMVYLKDATRGFHDLTACLRADSNMLCVGMLYHNGKAGRCGEWKLAETLKIKQQLFVDKKDYVVAKIHNARSSVAPS